MTRKLNKGYSYVCSQVDQWIYVERVRLTLKQVDIHSEGGRVKMSLVDIYIERG